jgi:hypothetical protein
MKTPNLRLSLLRPSLAALLILTCARAEDAVNTLKFSDPSKPGTVKISLGRGDLRVQGADTKEVTIKSDAQAETSKPRKDGLRVISASSSFALKESDNFITIDTATQDWNRGNSDFRLTVPRNTNIIVQNAWGGDITCTSIAGDIEITCMHGEIRLDDVSGGVIAGTMHGEIRASIRELREGKPLSFTSMNGEVILRVPENAKATVRLRTQNGSVLTDFDESILTTKTEVSPSRGKSVLIKSAGGSKVLTTDVQDAIREATQLSATAVREALEAVKEGLESARMEADEARKQLDHARKEIDRARKEAEAAQRESETSRRDERVARTNRDGSPAAPAAPTAPTAPAATSKPPKVAIIPTVSGGKLVTGTLNGGGPEIQVATMNGDVILRKLEAAKK